jgi:hypothetical protein
VQPYAGFEPQVGEIRALRTFRIGPGGVLYPLFSNTPWTAGTNSARCRALTWSPETTPPHAPPEPECSCGFYAYGSEHAAGEYAHARHVLAVVACWGRVIAGTRGLRAEYCRVEALWMSDTVPADLAAAVGTQYPAVAVFRDRALMVAEYPPTELDCYDLDEPHQTIRGRRWLQAVVSVTLAMSLLPAQFWGGLHNAQLVWAGALAVFVGAALLLARGRPVDLAARRRRVLAQAGVLWMIAPFAGSIGVLLLRAPLLQLSLLLLVQRYHLSREARRFPADVS